LGHAWAIENKKYAAYDRFHGNSPYGEIPTKKEPITTLGFAMPYNNRAYLLVMIEVFWSFSPIKKRKVILPGFALL